MRFTQAGLRSDGVFLGEQDNEGDPIPEFIGARSQDLQLLMQGLIAANERMREGELDSVLQAAATALGFVYIHPFQDGNGRLHRCLIHHVLAERKFAPRAWYSRSPRSCSTGSTPTETCCARIRVP
jgi:Fic family protein